MSTEINNRKSDDDFDYPIEICDDPFSERTIYTVEKLPLKNLRNRENLEDNDEIY